MEGRNFPDFACEALTVRIEEFLLLLGKRCRRIHLPLTWRTDI